MAPGASSAGGWRAPKTSAKIKIEETKSKVTVNRVNALGDECVCVIVCAPRCALLLLRISPPTIICSTSLTRCVSYYANECIACRMPSGT